MRDGGEVWMTFQRTLWFLEVVPSIVPSLLLPPPRVSISTFRSRQGQRTLGSTIRRPRPANATTKPDLVTSGDSLSPLAPPSPHGDGVQDHLLPILIHKSVLSQHCGSPASEIPLDASTSSSCPSPDESPSLMDRYDD